MLHSNHFFRSAYRTAGRFNRFMRRTAVRANMAPLSKSLNTLALKHVHEDVRSNPGRPGVQALLAPNR